MRFDGTLVITDPCYFIKDRDWDEVVRLGESFLDRLTTCPMIVTETGFGDWSCSVLDMETSQEIGRFAADAGMVCVTTLEDIAKYNYDAVQHLRDIPWCCFILPDFLGEVWFTHDSDNNTVVHTFGSHNLWGGMLYTDYEGSEDGNEVD